MAECVADRLRQQQSLSRSLLLIMTAASGVAVANIYYNQPLLSDMARSFGASAHQIGLVATATQIGYAAGMPLFIPLGDFVQRRMLVFGLFIAASAALVMCATAPNLGMLITASFLVGLTTVIAQILIPFAADLASDTERGKTIGMIMTGVLLGILLARTVSGVVAAYLGWRMVYWLAAGLALVFGVFLRYALPRVSISSTLGYGRLMRSIWTIVLEEAKLRRIALVAGLFFASFSAFWTTLIFLLGTSPYHYGSQTAGLFGLIGAVGAAVAPWSGRLADRRSPRLVVVIALAIVLSSFSVLWSLGFYLAGLVAGVILLDAGVQAAQVANQTRIFSLRPEARNRVNTVYMIVYFTGGSAGSLLGSFAWTWGHWPAVCGLGIAFMLLASVILFTEAAEPSR